MQAMDFLLPRPPFDLSAEKQAEFEALIESTPTGGFVDYQLVHPSWQFLSYLCQSRNLVLHGSQILDMVEVEPRKANDVKEFNSQNAIYATTDGIWVMYFAIIDRRRFAQLSLFNSCMDIRLSPDQVIGPFYFFSITHSALLQKPWCDGTVYVLPRENFEQDRVQPMLGVELIPPHWISYKPARPVLKVHVQPQDFPFLAQIHGHNDQKLVQCTAADPNGFPWPEALET